MKRRSIRIPRLLEWGERALKGFKLFHNAIKPHLTLSVKSSKNWIVKPVTPVMKANLLDEVLTIEEILCYPTLK